MNSLNGGCRCGRWVVEIRSLTSLSQSNPRVCDCDYCTAKDSITGVISGPEIDTEFKGSGTTVENSGDGLASFYFCDSCEDFLAVGYRFDVLRGAVSSGLFSDLSLFGPPIDIQPRFLPAEEKLERWEKLWGRLIGSFPSPHVGITPE